ncbi:MAG TPA: hypothetical protein VFR09_01565 [Alphaproteobacteria bacterium]|nr:hypothetical protein [Alphaproteobacteria bacterium]
MNSRRQKSIYKILGMSGYFVSPNPEVRQCLENMSTAQLRRIASQFKEFARLFPRRLVVYPSIISNNPIEQVRHAVGQWREVVQAINGGGARPLATAKVVCRDLCS